MKKAFVDLDGTLLDSKQRHVKVLQDVLNENGFFNVNISDYLYYKECGWSTQIYLENKLQFTKLQAKKISQEWINKIENEKYLHLDKWYSDAYYFLKKLKQLSYEVIIVTARNNNVYVYNFINDSSYSKFIDEVIVVSTKNASKNKVEAVKNKVDNNSIVIGDTEVDFSMADELNILSYILSRGFRNEEYFRNRNIKTYAS